MTATTWSLWQGEHRLADIYLRKPLAPDRLEGALFISAACTELSSVWQVRMEFPFGSRIFQHPQEPDVVAERGGRPLKKSSGLGALTEASVEELEGVPPNLRFVVRDEAGAVRSTRQVSLLAHRPITDAADPETDTFLPGVYENGTVWLIWVTF